MSKKYYKYKRDYSNAINVLGFLIASAIGISSVLINYFEDNWLTKYLNNNIYYLGLSISLIILAVYNWFFPFRNKISPKQLEDVYKANPERIKNLHKETYEVLKEEDKINEQIKKDSCL